MAKIMLVEDDNNLREIYEARLLAEGYEIVAAKDGEDALAMAVKEKPDLIISDVMMPKISGFDMLDILRSTPETKNTKVIMMTALSQAEDKSRADRLGADRYLVKSQVTLEDVAKVAQEVLLGESASTAQTASAEPPQAAPAEPVVETPQPSAPADPVPAPVAPQAPITEPTAPVQAAPDPVAQDPMTPPVDETPVVSAPVDPAPAPVTSIPVIDDSSTTLESAETPVATENPVTQSLPPFEIPAPAAPEAPVMPEASPIPTEVPVIAEELTQTSQQEADAAEDQINEILAQTDAPADISTAPENLEPTTSPEVIEVTETPTPTDVDGINQPVFSSAQASPIEVTTEPESAPIAEASAPEVQMPTESSAAAEQVFAPTEAPAVAEPSVPPQNPIMQPVPPSPQHTDNPDSAITGGQRVIQPINDISAKPDLNELLKKEEAKADVLSTTVGPAAPAAEQVVIPGATTQPSVPGANNETPATPPPTGSVISPNDISL